MNNAHRFKQYLAKPCDSLKILIAFFILGIYAIIFINAKAYPHLFLGELLCANAYAEDAQANAAQEPGNAGPEEKAFENKVASLKKMAQGFAQNLRFAEKPYYVGNFAFSDGTGKFVQLKNFKGKVLLVNLWASWCGVCRKELSQLSALEASLKDPHFALIPINQDRMSSNITNVLKQNGATNLTPYRDSSMKTFEAVRLQGLAVGLPVALIVDKQGYVVASFNGLAPWAGQDLQNFLRQVLAQESRR